MRLTAFPHHQIVSALVLDGQEDLGDHDEDPAFGRRVDGPGALHVGRVVSRVVGRLDEAAEISQLSATMPVCGGTTPC